MASNERGEAGEREQERPRERHALAAATVLPPEEHDEEDRPPGERRAPWLTDGHALRWPW
jgi:hypothetical protein